MNHDLFSSFRASHIYLIKSAELNSGLGIPIAAWHHIGNVCIVIVSGVGMTMTRNCVRGKKPPD